MMKNGREALAILLAQNAELVCFMSLIKLSSPFKQNKKLLTIYSIQTALLYVRTVVKSIKHPREGSYTSLHGSQLDLTVVVAYMHFLPAISTRERLTTCTYGRFFLLPRVTFSSCSSSSSCVLTLHARWMISCACSGFFFPRYIIPTYSCQLPGLLNVHSQ